MLGSSLAFKGSWILNLTRRQIHECKSIKFVSYVYLELSWAVPWLALETVDCERGIIVIIVIIILWPVILDRIVGCYCFIVFSWPPNNELCCFHTRDRLFLVLIGSLLWKLGFLLLADGHNYEPSTTLVRLTFAFVTRNNNNSIVVVILSGFRIVFWTRTYQPDCCLSRAENKVANGGLRLHSESFVYVSRSLAIQRMTSYIGHLYLWLWLCDLKLEYLCFCLSVVCYSKACCCYPYVR